MIAHVTERTVFVPSPRNGVGVMGGAYTTTLNGQSLISYHSYTSRSDTVDVACVRRSDDAGRSWSAPEEWPTRFDHPMGTRRRHPRGGYVDPTSGRYISMWTEGVLPTDDPLEGMMHWTLHYSVSMDGGQTDCVNEQIVHAGDPYDAVHHLPGVTVGKNCVMIGDLGQRPLTRSDGIILFPVQSTPTGPDGMYHNPGAGLTYTDCLMLMGTWEDTQLRWTASDRVVGDPARTTRGLIEPTIAELKDGSILMVMRGSNDVKPDWPAHKWVSRSVDGGQSWTPAEPWTYEDGHAFFSPSACSQLIPHSNGRLYWMGNLTPENPRGNRPRYPIVIGEVSLESGCLIGETVTILDDRQAEDSDQVTLSNFYTREDDRGDLLLYLPRLFSRGAKEWTTDLMQYRIVLQD
ncbi:MAG: sialidase family protein [bacterium]|nr:sialidase family protein [bacterium]